VSELRDAVASPIHLKRLGLQVPLGANLGANA
jgi:hypothetical protein